MVPGKTPNRDCIVEAVVLAFSKSKLKDVVGSDALRSVLTGQYRDMVAGSTMNLQVVYQLLHDQPGFNDDDARPPFCALKTWEKELCLSVVLPSNMTDLSATEIMAHGSHCPVPRLERQKVLYPVETRRQARITMSQALGEETTPPAPARKPMLEAALAVVAVVGLGFAIFSVVGYLGGPDFRSVKVEELSELLPIKSAKQLGTELNLVLSSESWPDESDAVRSSALREALGSLRDRDVTVLIVQDGSGVVRGSAQWVGTPPAIEVRLH